MPDSPPLTGGEIVGIIRDHWMANGMDWNAADRYGELGFAYMLNEGSIREWGFDPLGETLYEPCTPTTKAIVHVLIQKKEE